MQGRVRRLVVVLAGAGALVALAAPSVQGGSPQTRVAGSPAPLRPLVSKPAAFAVSEPLRTLAPTASAAGPARVVVHKQTVAPQGTATIPAPSVSFDGIGQVDSGVRPIPPDIVGEVGPNDYVQMVNLRTAVYSKTGKLLMAPVPLTTVFGPLGDRCGILQQGDPIVLYDQLANRWLLSQLGFIEDSQGDPVGPYYECIAISKTPDPTGQYFLYAFKVSDDALNDYPKLAVWPDGYYMTANQFSSGFSGIGYAGVLAVAFDRTKMLAGDPTASMVSFNLGQRNPNLYSMLPSDLDGTRLPPAGAPDTFVQVADENYELGQIAEQQADDEEGGEGEGQPASGGGGEGGDPDQRQAATAHGSVGGQNSLELFHFHVDWTTPANSAFTGPTVVPIQDININLCNFEADCIPQKGSFQTLDSLSVRTMFRAAYRNLGNYEALVLNETVNVGNDQAGIHWWEVRNPSGSPSLVQEGTWAPDAEDRWLGSIAMDGNGDIALGYSVSGPDLYPSIRYTGRLAGDPLGQMTLGEGTLMAGGGAQTHPAARWGDYSDLTVDPTDDCTFWYTNEYYKATSERSWSTRIGAFMLPGCDATPPTVTARNERVKAGKLVRLAYTTADNSGKTSEEITIFRPSGARLRTIDTPLHAAGAASVTFRAPRIPGLYAWNVVASDAKKNESDPSKAQLRVLK